MIKLKSLIKEIGNPPRGVYGHWIDSGGDMKPVLAGEGGHEKNGIDILRTLVKQKKLSQWEYDELHIPFNGSSEIDRVLYNHGYLRGVQDGPNTYYVNGHGGTKVDTTSTKEFGEVWG
jgi:hypothetical protein